MAGTTNAPAEHSMIAVSKVCRFVHQRMRGRLDACASLRRRRVAGGGRIRRVMIVAVARKLAIALWHFLEQGLVPQGAMLANR